MSDNVSTLHPVAVGVTTSDQAAFLRAMATQIEQDKTVTKMAIALAIQFDDGTVICPCSGFVDDTVASRYFSSFIKNQGFKG